MKADSLPPDPRSRKVAVVAFVIIAVILVGVGYWYYQSEKKEITHEKYQILAAIGELKAKQIQQWRKERVAEVERAAKDGLTRKAVSDVLTAVGDQKLQKELQECLRDELTWQDNGAALLFDTNGNLLASTDATAGPADPATLKAICKAIDGNKSAISDFYAGPNGSVHIDLASPVPDDKGQTQGILILRHEARSYLYPLLQEWPTPSPSAETILVQRDGNDVVFLNNLRHRSGTALSLRYPLTETQLPAVQAVLGKQGVFEGKDYRGVEVVSALLPISGSPWFIEAKVDAEEIFAEARYRASLISLIIGLFILLAAGLVALFYRQRQAGILNNLVKAERQKTEAQKRELDVARHHQTILQTAMDGFVLVDAQGSIREVNDAYCKMSGYSEQELLAMRISDLEASESREESDAHIQKVLTQGQDHFESRHRRKDGKFIDVEVSVQLRLADGSMAAFIRDITERKRAEKAIRESEARYRSLVEGAPDIVYTFSNKRGGVYYSSRVEQVLGHSAEYLYAHPLWWNESIHPDDRPRIAEAIREFEQGKPFDIEYRIHDAQGNWLWLQDRPIGRINGDDEVLIEGIATDITEQKVAEAKIKRLSVLYAALSECSQAIVRSKSADELLERVCRIVVDQGEMKLAWIGMADASGDVRVQTAYGPGVGYLEGIRVTWNAGDPLGSGPTGTVIREGKPFWCNSFMSDSRTSPWQERAGRFGWKSTAAIPLHLRGKTIGALTIYDDVSEVFDEEARRLFFQMEKTIGFALDHFANEDERKSAEEALRESEMLLHESQAIAGLGSYSLNIKTGMWVGSDVMDKVLGIEKAPAHSVEEWIALVHLGDRNMMTDYFQSEVLGKGRDFDKEYRVIRPADHREIWVSGIGKLEFDAEGQPVRMFGTIQDISGRKRAEEQRKTLLTAVEQSANTIVITDRLGTIEYVNPAFEKNTGYAVAEAIGQNPRILKSGEQAAGFYSDLWTTIVSGETWQGELLNKRKDGSPYWESATISPVHDDKGEILHFIAIKENITERKAMQATLTEALHRAEAGSRTKSEFLAIMSHELRTPLNGVLGFAELLSGTDLDEEQEAFAATIRKSGDHLLAIVNDILDFSSIEKGAMSIHYEPLAIADIVKESERAVLKSAMEKGIALQSAIEPGTPEQILGDGQRIRQILLNLLGNAVKFTSSGSVTTRVATVSEDGRRFLNFSVEDTGIGISPETIHILFKPFTQADMKMNRTFGGTGLGLAISQRLAEAMDGKITVVSAVGRGSTFTFQLPMDTPAQCGANAISPSPSASIPRSNASDDSASGSGQTPSSRPVLVVEDDSTNSMLTGKMLQLLGYRAEFAVDGAQALAAFFPGKYSAILMDIQMPVMNGFETTGKIRELESGTHVPIIALTAKVMPGDRERCLAAGMDDFLAKPFKRADLAAKLASFIQQS